VIRRQLDLFQSEQKLLLAEVARAERAYNRASAADAGEMWGQYIDLVEQAEEELLGLRDHFAATMDARERLRYEREFTRAAERQLPTLVARRQYERAIDPEAEH
jgi:hypothetical protein